MTRDWDVYAEVLKRVARAGADERRRQERLATARAKSRQAADTELTEVRRRHDDLVARADALEQKAETVLSDAGISPLGDRSEVPSNPVTTSAEAARELARLDEQLTRAGGQLTEASEKRSVLVGRLSRIGLWAGIPLLTAIVLLAAGRRVVEVLVVVAVVCASMLFTRKLGLLAHLCGAVCAIVLILLVTLTGPVPTWIGIGVIVLGLLGWRRATRN
jgi:hypothetical protein